MPGKKMWVYAPSRRSKPKVDDFTKMSVSGKADKLIESVLKPKHVQSAPSDGTDFNYIVDIYSKWHGSYLYFCSKYRCPGPHAIAPFFESKFARIEFIGKDRFALSFMRHTEQWWEIGTELTLEQCLKAIAEDPLFQP